MTLAEQEMTQAIIKMESDRIYIKNRTDRHVSLCYDGAPFSLGPKEVMLVPAYKADVFCRSSLLTRSPITGAVGTSRIGVLPPSDGAMPSSALQMSLLWPCDDVSVNDDGSYVPGFAPPGPTEVKAVVAGDGTLRAMNPDGFSLNDGKKASGKKADPVMAVVG